MPKNPHADFTPTLAGYSGISPFRFWCQTALPLTYDDSLSYYELLNKVVNYLNHTIEDLTNVENNTSELAEAYEKLQKYVNDYFDDIDIEAELRNVLDKMAEDGTLDALLDPLVENQLPGVVDEKIDGVVASQIDKAVAGQIDESVADQLPAIVEDSIPGKVSDWLNENVNPVGSAVAVDSSLTISGAAADAKVTGDAISDLKTQLGYPTYTIVDNTYINYSNGTERPLSQYKCTGFIEIENLDFGIKTYVNNDAAGIAFYDSTQTFIENSGYSTYSDNGIFKKIIVPNNAKYFRASCLTSNISEFEIKYYGIADTLNDFVDKTNEEESNINAKIAGAIRIYDGQTAFTDADDAELNRMYLIMTYTGISNLPVSSAGTLITYGEDNTATTQLYTTNTNGDLWYRRKWGTTWSAWVKIANSANSILIHTGNNGITDANDAELNKIYLILTYSNVSHLPVKSAGTLFSYGRHTDAITQFYTTNTNAEFWYRRKWGTTWSAWEKIQFEKDNSGPVLDVLQTFSNITCCGDSLTYSAVYTASNTYRQAFTPYPEVLKKMTGTETTYKASTGYTAIDWWTQYANTIAQKTNQCAIIYLGTNGGFTDTLSTDAPSNADPSTWADTNTGCLAKIVNAFITAGAKVIMIKCYRTSGEGTSDLTNTNKVIKDVADRFHCGLVENELLSNDVYHYWPDLQGKNTVHYNDLGYTAFTRQLLNNIAWMNKDYLKYIIPVS